MKTNFKIDFINRTIITTKAALNRASKFNSPEYRELCEILSSLPDFKVTVQERSKSHRQNFNRGLTFSYMEKYIMEHENSLEALEIFHTVLELAETETAKYPFVKKWFLAKYPEACTCDYPEAA